MSVTPTTTHPPTKITHLDSRPPKWHACVIIGSLGVIVLMSGAVIMSAAGPVECKANMIFHLPGPEIERMSAPELSSALCRRSRVLRKHNNHPPFGPVRRGRHAATPALSAATVMIMCESIFSKITYAI